MMRVLALLLLIGCSKIKNGDCLQMVDSGKFGAIYKLVIETGGELYQSQFSINARSPYGKMNSTIFGYSNFLYVKTQCPFKLHNDGEYLVFNIESDINKAIEIANESVR